MDLFFSKSNVFFDFFVVPYSHSLTDLFFYFANYELKLDFSYEKIASNPLSEKNPFSLAIIIGPWSGFTNQSKSNVTFWLARADDEIDMKTPMKVSLFNETRSQVAISMIKLKAVLNVFILHLHFLSAGDGRAF